MCTSIYMSPIWAPPSSEVITPYWDPGWEGGGPIYFQGFENINFRSRPPWFHPAKIWMYMLTVADIALRQRVFSEFGVWGQESIGNLGFGGV